MFEQGTINQNSEVYVRVRYRHKQCFCLVFFRHHGSYSNLHADRGSKITYFMTLSLRGRELQNCRALQWRIQDFPEEGAPTSQEGANIRLCQNFPKLHEIERIWTPGGALATCNCIVGSFLWQWRVAPSRCQYISRDK